MTLLKESRAEDVEDGGLGRELLEKTLKSQVTKAKTDKRHYLKLKSICTAMNITNRVMRKSTKCEKVFSNYSHNKGLMY
jgi:hypothetical protein